MPPARSAESQQPAEGASFEAATQTLPPTSAGVAPTTGDRSTRSMPPAPHARRAWLVIAALLVAAAAIALGIALRGT
jgi:hypothetical protein